MGKGLTRSVGKVKLKIMSNLSICLRLLAGPQDKSSYHSQGQALLIILLIMAVALTIGLSVVSRSITDIRISQQTEEAARAYSAAEAGIESALVGGSLSGTFPETQATYSATVASNYGAGNQFVLPGEMSPNEIQTVYLATYNSSNTPPFGPPYYTASTIEVCWQGSAAIEVTTYYRDGTTYKVAREAVDPDEPRGLINGFSEADSGSCAGLNNRKVISLPNGASITLLFLRLRIFYASAKVGVVGFNLPSQGAKIESVGQAGTATRKVEVVRFHPAPPEIFDFTLYSGQGLEKTTP